MKRNKIAKILLIIASTAHIMAYLYAAPEHIVDEAWPPHARFHVLQSLILIVGANSIVIGFILKVRDIGERGVWWILFSAGIVIHGAYFFSFFAGGWPDELSSHIGLAIILFLYGLGLALARPNFNSRYK